MSHTTAIKSVVITDVEALKDAVKELAAAGIPCRLEDNAVPRAYYQNQTGLGKADMVLRLDRSRYDVGFYKQPDGSYQPRTDFWGGDVEKQLGSAGKDEQSKLGKLFQLYGVNAATRKARAQGYMVSRVKQADGSERLTITGF